ncbi:hypothetical protein EWM64_g10735 [Hericium alpestre]|uniref:Uncharacterized protein n=1 Tax=Hericium alpestre TaxID=135208 RepID=A0A4Y9ZGY4_9AGAM|nr:hypothetical protein EWM64_g10735 [Hericium alpestre]
MPSSKARDKPPDSKPPYYIDEPRAQEINLILHDLEEHGWNCLGSFIKDVLALPNPKRKDFREQYHIQKVVAFLGPTTNAQSLVKADEIAEIMYSHRYSFPKAAHNSKNRTAAEAKRPDRAKMAQGLLEEWAVKKVESIVSAEADSASSKDIGFHLRDRFATWDSILHFSMTGILSMVKS